jgi:hypothetical protein
MPAPEVVLMYHNDVVEAFAANAPDAVLLQGFYQELRGAMTTSSMPILQTRCRKHAP